MNIQTLILAVLTLALPAFAEHGKWHAEFLKHWTVSKEFTLAVAELMPADGYESRPNAEEMKFGELMIHIADANNRNFALIAGIEAPPKPATTGREAAMKYLGEWFDFCARIAEGLTRRATRQTDRYGGPSRYDSA